MNRRADVDQVVDKSMVRNTDIVKTQEKNRAMISHDLRTALSGITGGLAQIDISVLDDDLGALLAQVRSSGRHLAKLMDAAFSEGLLAGDEPLLVPVPVRLGSLLEEVSDLWRRRASEKGLSFEIETEPGCPDVVSVDNSAFHRLMGNLLGNAIKFTANGGIRILAQNDGSGDLVLAVQDTGPGFSEAAMDVMFQMYGRPQSSSVPGTGVGLHIAKTITEKMGGSIGARNRSKGGAEVTVRLPVPVDLSAAVEAAPRSQLLPDLSRLKILLAEDNTTNQLVVTQMLRAMKAEPVLASDGVEALARFEEDDFDIALLDIEMPRVSGLDVIRRIRNRLDNKSSVRLIALTAYAMKEHRDRIFDAGADGLIPKPLTSIEELGNQILAYAGKPAPSKTGVAENAAASDDAEIDNEDVIDRQIYDALSDAIGSESMDELKHKVAEDMEKVSEGVAQGIKNLDAENIRFHTHILISVAGVIGATQLQSIAQRLNSMAQRPGHPEMEALAAQCINGISGVLNVLRVDLRPAAQ